jgi:hypothetical protein
MKKLQGSSVERSGSENSDLVPSFVVYR